MDRSEVLNQINIVFRETLDDEKLEIKEETTADDVENWDSLSHIQLVVAVEKHFNVRFTSKEIQSWNNVGEMVSSIRDKI